MRAPGAALRVRQSQKGVDGGLEVGDRLARREPDAVAIACDLEEEHRGAALLPQQTDGGAVVLVVDVVCRNSDEGAIPAKVWKLTAWRAHACSWRYPATTAQHLAVQGCLAAHLAAVAACGYVPGGRLISCSVLHLQGSLVSTSCTTDSPRTVTKKRLPPEKASGMKTQLLDRLPMTWAGCARIVCGGRGRRG